MRPLIIRAEAEADIEEAFAWYEQQSPGLGRSSSVRWMQHSQLSNDTLNSIPWCTNVAAVLYFVASHTPSISSLSPRA